MLPEFRQERVPVARFLCRKLGQTFSLLPIQLIPYVMYTVGAVVKTLLAGLGCRRSPGVEGFWGASVAVDPDSSVTPWLVFTWLRMVFCGLERGHRTLSRWYDLRFLSTSGKPSFWRQVGGYFKAFAWEADSSGPRICDVLSRYGREARTFLFGRPSQERRRHGILAPV